MNKALSRAQSQLGDISRQACEFTSTEKAAPDTPTAVGTGDDRGRFPDLRVVTCSGLPTAHKRSSGISDRLAVYSCGGSFGFGKSLTEFPFTRSFPRHLDRVLIFNNFNNLSIHTRTRNLHDDHEPFRMSECYGRSYGLLNTGRMRI